MRLWHESLLSRLPRQQLLGQHRECAALRGAGWGRRHSVVNYVFAHSPALLVAYHWRVMDEMERRGYHPDQIWRNPDWRGNTLNEQAGWGDSAQAAIIYQTKELVYPEHNGTYLRECLDNLANKGVKL